MTEVPSPTVNYPPATRLDLVEHLHGHPVADPYRWLEDPTDPRTEGWSSAQDVLTRNWLDAMPGRKALGSRLTEMMRAGSVMTPTWRAGRAFFTRRQPGQEHPVLLVREVDGTERVLVDVGVLDTSGLTTLDSWTPSPDGRRLAYQVSVGGDENSLLHVVEVDSGQLVEGPIDRCRYSPVAWLPSGEEFFYVRQLRADLVPDGEDMFHRRVWRHRVGTDPEQDQLVHGEGLDHTYFFGLHLSHDGRWLVVDGAPGTVRRDSVWLADLCATGSKAPELRQLLDETDGARCTAWVGRDGRLYLLTTLDAPMRRLCVADPAYPERENWTELVAEDPGSVLDSVRLLGGQDAAPSRLVALRTRHAVSELHLHDPGTGEHVGEIRLPGKGSVHGLSTVDSLTSGGRDMLWIGWTDFTTPACVHVYSLSTGRTELAEAAPGAVSMPEVRTQLVEYVSTDGTVVRMFLITPVAVPDQARPALLGGYGGFALSRKPGYSPSALAWVQAGGVWALASLRGGGEEGEAWHHAGRRGRKQNVFDDFHGAAEHLIHQGWTTPEQLAIMGGSNGGLLVGAALTQRPELYRAVVCSAPLLDMVRYEQFLLGRLWADEYGSAADPEQLRWLLSYSPYHHVRPTVEYPATLFTVFEADSRVDPNHARKMCAALQHATVGDPDKRPVLIRREVAVGHSARSVSRSVELAVDQYTFLAHAVGLDLDRLG